MRATLAAVLLVSGTLATSAIAARSADRATNQTAPPLQVPAGLAQALVRQGYPAHQACGSVMEPPPPSRTHGSNIIIRVESVPACWLVMYTSGYSVSITPRSSRAAARLAYLRTHNRWARSTRSIAIGTLLVSGFRLPEADWKVIVRTVSAVAG